MSYMTIDATDNMERLPMMVVPVIDYTKNPRMIINHEKAHAKAIKFNYALISKEIAKVLATGLVTKLDTISVKNAKRLFRLRNKKVIKVVPEGYVEVNEFVISLGYSKSYARTIITNIGAEVFYKSANRRYYSPESQEIAREYQRAMQAKALDFRNNKSRALVYGNLMDIEATKLYNEGISGNVFSDYALAIDGEGNTQRKTVSGRIDNLIVNGNDYHILEFKTGNVYISHEVQVRRYAMDLVEEFGKDINIIIHKVYSDHPEYNSVVSADAHSVVSDYEDAKAIHNTNKNGKLND